MFRLAPLPKSPTNRHAHRPRISVSWMTRARMTPVGLDRDGLPLAIRNHQTFMCTHWLVHDPSSRLNKLPIDTTGICEGLGQPIPGL